jgi:two-component system, sensor histidine kinase RegB
VDKSTYRARYGLNPYLLQLVLLRTAGMMILAIGLWAAHALIAARLELVPLALTGVVVTLADALTIVRLRLAQPVEALELFLQLLLTITALTSALHFAGGASNPFVGCYPLLLLFCARSAPGARFIWALGGICVACCALLYLSDVPAASRDGRDTGGSAHYGLVAALAALAAWIAVHLDEVRRTQEAILSRHLEKDARESYLVGLATLSAGTAHEISTPLSTMSVIVGDLRRSARPPADWRESIDTLWTQLQACKRSLVTMAGAADGKRLDKVQRVSAKQLIEDVSDRFRLLRPDAVLKVRRVRVDGDLALETDHTIQQALFNFLDNAARVSPRSVELCAGRTDTALVIQILDRGPGIDALLRARLGTAPIPRRGPNSGTGHGVLIAHAAVERFGGCVRISERSGGGTCVEIELPVHDMIEEADNDRRHRVNSR